MNGGIPERGYPFFLKKGKRKKKKGKKKEHQ
jgi:hypothetical protein